MGVGTLVGILIEVLVFEPLAAALGLHSNPLGAVGCFNPMFWAGGLPLGAFINYYTRHRSAYWVGLFGVGYLLATILYYHTTLFPHPSIYQNPDNTGYSLQRGLYWLFSPTCKGGECLEQFLVTLPVLNSIAYSLGAWFGLRFAHQKNRGIIMV